jgi:hypothetical protein
VKTNKASVELYRSPILFRSANRSAAISTATTRFVHARTIKPGPNVWNKPAFKYGANGPLK